jgi:hypothetical protein
MGISFPIVGWTARCDSMMFRWSASEPGIVCRFHIFETAQKFYNPIEHNTVLRRDKPSGAVPS